MDRSLESKRIESFMPPLSGLWMVITVLVLIVALVSLFINIKAEGEGVVGITAMALLWVFSIALFPCMCMVARLNSPTTGTMIGRFWNPFNIGIIIAYILALIFMRRLGREPSKN